MAGRHPYPHPQRGSLVAAAALGLLFAAAPAHAAQRPTTSAAQAKAAQATIDLLLASERPPSDKELRGLGRDADRVLIAVASDGKLEPRIRLRAVSALGQLPSAASRAFLAKLVGQPAAGAPSATDLLLTRRAALSLGWQGGLDVPAQLAPLLRHADPDVRVDAALALGLTRLPPAADLLRTRLPVETDARVRGHISRQLRVLETALGLAPDTSR